MKFPWGKIKNAVSALLPGAASFVIASGWNWYHLPHRPHTKIILATLVVTLLIWLAYIIGKKILLLILRKKTFHPFWTSVFPNYLNRLYLSFASLFLVFFSPYEITSLIYFALALTIVFFTLESIFKQHPRGKDWQKINRLLFIWAMFLFIINSICQYFAFRYYILDLEAKYYNVSLFRAWAMTAMWLGLFSASYLVYLKTNKKIRYLAIGTLIFFFLLFIILWSFNIGILYFSGLNLNPTAIMHTGGANGVIYNKTNLILVVFLLINLVSFFLLKKKLIHYHQELPARYWRVYHWSIIAIALVSVAGLSSFRTAPEFAIIKSFYQSIVGQTDTVILQPIVKEKLKRFGLNYNYDEFYLAHKETTYSTSIPLLSPQLKNKKPNVIIVFLESFSSRLTSLYNPTQVPSSTPGLELMAKNPNTTVFKKYYNASTPTITGLMAQLCSFLPPTGHEEITTENRLRSHHLLCLPKILKENGWQYANYVTAVEKNFANKDTIFASMGTDEVYGTEELRDIVKAEPLSWGFSDHQLFPALEKIIANKKEPYLTMLSTVDTHPPFTIAQDMVYYGDGKNNVLNSAHTTDDAFRIFWEKFVSSTAAQNTIVIAVADHAIFPTAITKDKFPDVAGKLNFYDETAFLMYVPNSTLPAEVDRYSSSLDLTPTLLQVLDLNIPNSFDGHSIFDDRSKYPNLLGMHELGLYTNEARSDGTRATEYSTPSALNCSNTDFTTDPNTPLTLCEFLNFYQWKRQMMEQGRFWEN